jgi:GAF domain-containing protein
MLRSARPALGRAVVGAGAARIHNLAAALPLPDHPRSRKEILLVENAETDSRINADICHQLGASALLIIPITQGHTLAGVLAVLFSEPHRFENREVCTYQLMASLAAESMSPQVEKQLSAKSLQLNRRFLKRFCE